MFEEERENQQTAGQQTVNQQADNRQAENQQNDSQQTGSWQAYGQEAYNARNNRQSQYGSDSFYGNQNQGNQNQQTWQDSDRYQGQQTWQNTGRSQAGQGNRYDYDYYNAGRDQQTRQAGQQSYQENTQKHAGKEKKKKEKVRGGFGVGKAIAIGLCCSLLGGVIGAGGVLLGSRLLDSGEQTEGTVVFKGDRPVSAINVAKVDTSKLMTPAEVYAANVNSTVGITTMVTTNYWGYQTTSPASGSGFVLTADGYIITNYHVIENSSSITVTTYDGTAYDAQLVGYDDSNDIAVLKVEATDLTPVVLGDSDNANVGDSVVAIGNPLGELTFSLASGAISALNRSVTFSTGLTMDLIQVDCAINAGNSGGPLFNLYGEVIGITNAKYSNNGDSSQASIENIGFAIPISDVQGIIESIIKNGYISKPYIGISFSTVSDEAQSYGIPLGAAIMSVAEDGPADKAGLQANDIITKVGDTEITKADDLKSAVSAASIGDELVFTVYRQGKTIEITVTVGEDKKSAMANEEESSQQQQQQRQQQQPDSGFPFSFPWNFFGF